MLWNYGTWHPEVEDVDAGRPPTVRYQSNRCDSMPHTA